MTKMTTHENQGKHSGADQQHWALRTSHGSNKWHVPLNMHLDMLKINLWGHKRMLPFVSLTGLSAVLLSVAALFQHNSDPVAEGDAFSIPSKPERLRSTEGLHFCLGSRNQHWTALLLIRLNDRAKAASSKTSHTHAPGMPSKPRTALICIQRKKALHNIT